MNRREFIKTGAFATAAALSGCTSEHISQTAKAPFFTAQGEIRAMLMHLGWNMWSDIPVTQWGPFKGDELKIVCAADHVRTDMRVWRTVTEQMAADGYNMIVIDLGEACFYPSHPELAVKGTFSVEEMRKELNRLRKLGLEPIPKLNFSAAHDTWLKEYERMVSTSKYYSVCADIIHDVCEIFENPRYLHLGYDEETDRHQRRYAYSIVRKGDLWWHDFRFFVDTVEKNGSQAWIWSDFIWHHKKEFISKMPKSVLQSNWYYSKSFDLNDPVPEGYETFGHHAYLELEKAGFDQIPCGSNWSCEENFPSTVAFARKHIAPSRLKGFLNAPWFFPTVKREKHLLDACRIGRMAWDIT